MDSSQFLLSLIPLLIFNGIFCAFFFVFILISKKRPKSDFIENRHASVFLSKFFREYWIWITDPIVRFFIKNKISPNKISFIGSLLGMLAGLFYAQGLIGLASWTMIFGASFDIFDGRVARETNNITRSGAFFDSVLDRISESVVFTGLAYFYRDGFIFWAVMAAYLGAMMTSYAKCKGNSMGVDYEGGTMQRPERIVYIGVGGIFIPIIAYLLYRFIPALQSGDLMSFTYRLYALPITFVAIMSNVTAIDRIIKNMKLLDQTDLTKAS